MSSKPKSPLLKSKPPKPGPKPEKPLKPSKKRMIGEKAISKISIFQQTRIILDEEEKEILNFIKDKPGSSTTEIYKLYNEKFNKTDRTFRRKISTLKEFDLIYVKEEKISGTQIPHFFPKNSNS